MQHIDRRLFLSRLALSFAYMKIRVPCLQHSLNAEGVGAEKGSLQLALMRKWSVYEENVPPPGLSIDRLYGDHPN